MNPISEKVYIVKIPKAAPAKRQRGTTHNQAFFTPSLAASAASFHRAEDGLGQPRAAGEDDRKPSPTTDNGVGPFGNNTEDDRKPSPTLPRGYSHQKRIHGVVAGT